MLDFSAEVVELDLTRTIFEHDLSRPDSHTAVLRVRHIVCPCLRFGNLTRDDKVQHRNASVKIAWVMRGGLVEHGASVGYCTLELISLRKLL